MGYFRGTKEEREEDKRIRYAASRKSNWKKQRAAATTLTCAVKKYS